MNRNGRADRARVMGIRWIWNYRARKWVGNSLVGSWYLWLHDGKWLLASPEGAIYTLDKRERLAAMVQAGFKIAEVERDLAGR
jgi:hypothetical protein